MTSSVELVPGSNQRGDHRRDGCKEDLRSLPGCLAAAQAVSMEAIRLSNSDDGDFQQPTVATW